MVEITEIQDCTLVLRAIENEELLDLSLYKVVVGLSDIQNNKIASWVYEGISNDGIEIKDKYIIVTIPASTIETMSGIYRIVVGLQKNGFSIISPFTNASINIINTWS